MLYLLAMRISVSTKGANFICRYDDFCGEEKKKASEEKLLEKDGIIKAVSWEQEMDSSSDSFHYKRLNLKKKHFSLDCNMSYTSVAWYLMLDLAFRILLYVLKARHKTWRSGRPYFDSFMSLSRNR